MAKLPSNIISLEDDDDSINLLVYGPSGVGKTVFGGSDPKVLFIAAETGGTLSAKRQGSKAKKWTVTKWSDVEEAYDWLYDNPDHGFDWVVIDSITEFQQIMLRGILDMAVSENAKRDQDIPAIQDHQKWQNMFKRFVKAYNALPVNILWTALVRNVQDEEANEFLTPDIQGKGFQMSQAIASYMTSYGFMKVRRVKDKETGKIKSVRRITWQDTGVIRGKDRTNVLAPYTEDKTLAEITKMISDAVPIKTAIKPSSKTAKKETA